MVISAYFHAGTKIMMADKTIKLIEDIKVGDCVNALGEEESVIKIYHSISVDLISITRKSGVTIMVTPEQSFRVNAMTKTFAKNIKIGDLIFYLADDGDLLVEPVSNVTYVKAFNNKVYSFSLKDNHNFNANGFLSLDFTCQQIR
ncbi:MAG: Hint domain-containing protein [Muribaculaceae bacterium]|nr:Hint domain-containing protein [Muribaculaceae bacterium]